MKKRIFATMLLFTSILSLTSCSKDDGDWDAMKWEKNNYEEALTPSFGKAIGVPKLGGTYTFKCKNYKNFWIEYVDEQVGDKTIKNVPAYDDKPYSEVKGSYTSSKVEGNTLTVTFAPNETQDGRYVRVEVSAGDIFDKIITMLPYFRSMEAFFNLSLPKSWADFGPSVLSSNILFSDALQAASQPVEDG